MQRKLIHWQPKDIWKCLKKLRRRSNSERKFKKEKWMKHRDGSWSSPPYFLQRMTEWFTGPRLLEVEGLGSRSRTPHCALWAAEPSCRHCLQTVWSERERVNRSEREEVLFVWPVWTLTGTLQVVFSAIVYGESFTCFRSLPRLTTRLFLLI